MCIKTNRAIERMTTSRRNDTTVAISGKRKDDLNDSVVKFIIETRETIRMSEIVHYLIDEYLEEAIKDMIAKELQAKKEANRARR
jgi:hypothetical protein